MPSRLSWHAPAAANRRNVPAFRSVAECHCARRNVPAEEITLMQEMHTLKPEPDVVPIPGDTFALREELKALGAVWDKAEKVWRITPDKLTLATALVENQALLPPQPKGTAPIADPFEQEASGPRRVTLGKQDGATYEALDALRAVGATWDKEGRRWTIREERADYARAVLKAVSGSPTPTHSGDERTTPVPVPPPPASVPAPTQEAASAEAKPVVSGAVPVGAVLLCGLRVRKDEAGKTYLEGDWSASTRALVVPNPNRMDKDDASHLLYVVPLESPNAG